MPVVASFYHFAPLADPGSVRPPLLARCLAHGVRGTILLAPEGVNGTIAGAPAAVAEVVGHLRGLPGCDDLASRQAPADDVPFGRMKVRLKREIVTMGQPDVDPRAAVGRRVAPRDWNALIAASDVALIDTRNAYEVAIGSFPGAIDPGTARFGDFPGWWQANRQRLAGRRIAMFCTGGIRCEKSTSYLAGQGVSQVYHLDGGILRYLEEVPESDSLWQGQCFVFDRRVSVGPGLVPGGLTTCGACRRPLSPADLGRPEYEAGVSCPACRSDHDARDRARFRERHRQMRLAAAAGRLHLGPA
jgi:UPF0176 protein